jgi:hypothetical protein
MAVVQLAQMECDLLEVCALGVDVEQYLDVLRLGADHCVVVEAVGFGIELENVALLLRLGVEPGSVVAVHGVIVECGVGVEEYKATRETGCGHDAPLEVWRGGVPVATYRHLAGVGGCDVGGALERLAGYLPSE